MPTEPNLAVERLRAKIAKIEAGARADYGALPFGLPKVDDHLPGGGLTFGALHEVAGGGEGAIHGGASALFAAAIAGRTRGKVLWCLARQDLFAPALSGVGLKPDRVIYFEAGDEKAVFTAFEDGLRHGGFGAVVGEVARLSMTASRRLQLSAEETGSLGIAVRRWRHEVDTADFGQPTVAVTRWRVTALPSSPLPTAGVGRPRWFVELVRCRAAESAEFELEAPDEAGRLALPAYLADRSDQASPWARRAAG